MNCKLKQFQNVIPYLYVLDYLTATGTQYIDTGVVGYGNSTNYTRAEIKVNLSEVVANAQIFGSKNTSNVERCYVGLSSNKYLEIASNNVSYHNKNFIPTKNIDYVLSASWQRGTDNLTLYANDGSVNNECTIQTNNNNFTTGSNTLLFPKIRNDVNGSGAKGKYYYCKIWTNDTLERDLVPAEKIDNGTIGFYDRINKVFYTNSGTGKFTAGNRTGEKIWKVL